MEPRLYDADAADLLAVLHELPDDVHTVVLDEHNPGLENLATLLTDRPVRRIDWCPPRGGPATDNLT